MIKIADRIGKIPAFVITVIALFFVFWGMFFYVWWRFSVLFDMDYTHWFLISIFIAWWLVLLNCFNFITKKVVHYLALFVVFIFTCLIVTAITLAIEQVFRLNFWTSGIWLWVVLICVIIGIILLGYFQHKKLINTILVVQSEKIKKNRKLIFISDLHVDWFHWKRFIKNLVWKIMLEEPDCVLIWGDLVNIPNKSYIRYFRSFKRINVPIYAVIWNHDVYFGDDISIIEKVCNEWNISLLRNQSFNLFDDIQLVGIDDEELRNGKKLRKILNETDMKNDWNFTILLSHRPYRLSKLVHTPVDLELAGHTHKGQIWGFTQFSQYLYDYVYGLVKWRDKKAFTSQWVGSLLPIRLWTQGEIVVLHLETK